MRTAILGAGWCWLNLRALPNTCITLAAGPGRPGVGRSAATLHCAASAVRQRQRGGCYHRSQGHRLRYNGTPTRDRANRLAVQHLCHAGRQVLHGADRLLRFLQRRALQLYQQAGRPAPRTGCHADVMAQRRTRVVRNHAKLLPAQPPCRPPAAGWRPAQQLLRCGSGVMSPLPANFAPPATSHRARTTEGLLRAMHELGEDSQQGPPRSKGCRPLEGAKRLRVASFFGRCRLAILTCCRAAPAPGSVLLVMVLPPPTVPPAPMVTGATSAQLLPMFIRLDHRCGACWRRRSWR